MSWHRQIRILVALDITLVVFVAWVAITNLMFGNVVDYKLFFLSLAAVFFMQYIYSKKNNKQMALILPLIVSVPFVWILFKSMAALLNLVFVAFIVYINLSAEVLLIDYAEYRLKAKHAGIFLVVISFIALGLEKSIADYLYRFVMNFIIVTVVLLRESRAYCYKVRKDEKSIVRPKISEVIKKILINVFLKYGLVAASTIMLTTNWFFDKTLGLVTILNKGLDIIISFILDIFGRIIGNLLLLIVNVLRKPLAHTDFLSNYEKFSQSLKNIVRNTNFEGESTAADNFILYTTIKMVLLLIIILFAIDVVHKMRFLKHKNEQYNEDKEKIEKNISTQKNNKRKNSIPSMFRKAFKGNNIKEKILYAYRDFEKATEKAKIYKVHMTATQLKNTTKANIEKDVYLEEMTDIYNEVKFSNCEPKENQLNLMKKGVEHIRKQL